MRNAQLNSVTQIKGVGMVEVLVTVFVLSIGLLGIASLQFVGTMANTDAFNRSQSTLIVQQMIERLRANSVMSTQGNGLVVDGGYFTADNYNFENLSCTLETSDFNCFCLTVPETMTDCKSTECTAAEFAIFDGYEMSCAVAAMNPGISIAVSCADNNDIDVDACSAGSRHTILLRWPVESWLNKERVLNADCNIGVSEPHDCVSMDLTL